MAVISSSETRTLTSRGSMILTAVFIPFLHDSRRVKLNDLTDLSQLFWRESAIFAQRQRLHPEFADSSVPLNMDMLWLIAVKAVKE
jgi:hypothetical protein